MKRTSEEQNRALKGRELSRKFNEVSIFDKEGQYEILKELFDIKEDQKITIRPPFVCNDGKLVHFGNNIYINAFCVFEHATNIYIGDNVRIGPHVVLAATSHAIDSVKRIEGEQIQKEIKIEDNVMIGANSTILGGVTIGTNSVIGAGSVVVKDIPSNVVACGNPCEVIKKID